MEITISHDLHLGELEGAIDNAWLEQLPGGIALNVEKANISPPLWDSILSYYIASLCLKSSVHSKFYYGKQAIKDGTFDVDSSLNLHLIICLLMSKQSKLHFKNQVIDTKSTREWLKKRGGLVKLITDKPEGMFFLSQDGIYNYPACLSLPEAGMELFVRLLKKRTSNFFGLFSDVGNNQRTRMDDDDLFVLVYELYSNAVKYGCGREGSVKCLSLQYHKSPELYLDMHAGNIDWLKKYFKSTSLDRVQAEYVEITIFDLGKGLEKAYDDMNMLDSTAESSAKVLSVLTECKSETKRPGAGRGIYNALKVIRNRRGLMYIRTGTTCLVTHFEQGDKEDMLQKLDRPSAKFDGSIFKPAGFRESNIHFPGTFYTILLPL